VNDAAPSRPRLSAGVIVVRRTPQGPRFLLLRSFRYWDFPKGQVEAGETPLDAARRETREETGIGALSFDWGEGYFETSPTPAARLPGTTSRGRRRRRSSSASTPKSGGRSTTSTAG